LASEYLHFSPGGQRRPPGENSRWRRLLAVVRRRKEQWVFESDGLSEFAGETQLDAQFAAVRFLSERGGGELLIRDSDGRETKRLIVGPIPEADSGALG
jgi:hypothetical protein